MGSGPVCNMISLFERSCSQDRVVSQEFTAKNSSDFYMNYLIYFPCRLPNCVPWLAAAAILVNLMLFLVNCIKIDTACLIMFITDNIAVWIMSSLAEPTLISNEKRIRILLMHGLEGGVNTSRKYQVLDKHYTVNMPNMSRLISGHFKLRSHSYLLWILLTLAILATILIL